MQALINRQPATADHSWQETRQARGMTNVTGVSKSEQVAKKVKTEKEEKVECNEKWRNYQQLNESNFAK